MVKAVDVEGFDFTSHVCDTIEIKCPACEEFSLLRKWGEGYVDCEQCGEHPTLICPECYSEFDGVEDERPLEVRHGRFC